jgi:hypothetical protein
LYVVSVGLPLVFPFVNSKSGLGLGWGLGLGLDASLIVLLSCFAVSAVVGACFGATWGRSIVERVGLAFAGGFAGLFITIALAMLASFVLPYP